MIGQEENLMDELIALDSGQTAGKRFINRKQLVEIVTAMRRDGDEVEEILESLRDYVVDFKNSVDRPMVLPVIQDVDDGRYGQPRKWMNNGPSDMNRVRQETRGFGASMRPMEPQQIDLSGAGRVAPQMAQSMGITEQIRDMYHKYIQAFQEGDLDNAMFYKNAFNELLEMRNSMFPGATGAKKDDDDWAKQLMATMVTNMMTQQQQPTTNPSGDIFSELEKLGKVKDIMGWGNNAPQPGGLSENAAIAAMQVAAPELGKLTDTLGTIANQRMDGKKTARNTENFEEMKNKEREIKANYTSCPSCQTVIPKWAKQCHNCGAIFQDQFADAPSSEYGRSLPQRANAQPPAPEQLMAQGMAQGINLNQPEPIIAGLDAQQQALAARMQAQNQFPPQQVEIYDDYNDWEGEEMTEQEEWFENYYPRLEQWIRGNSNPSTKIQAIWQLAGSQEQRQLLFLAQERGPDGLLVGLQEFCRDHPEHNHSLDLLAQPPSRAWLDAMFKEVRLLANEDNLILTNNDINEYGRMWGDLPVLERSRPAPPVQMTPPMPVQPINPPAALPPSPQGVPRLNMQTQDDGLSLREKLRRRRNGQ